MMLRGINERRLMPTRCVIISFLLFMVGSGSKIASERFFYCQGVSVKTMKDANIYFYTGAPNNLQIQKNISCPFF